MQDQFKQSVVSSKLFSETEKSALECDTVAKFGIFWEQANNTRMAFDRSHEKGCGLLAKRYQISAVLVHDFMDAFSPIIDVVKDFGAPYGGFAIGTISILFAARLVDGFYSMAHANS